MESYQKCIVLKPDFIPVYIDRAKLYEKINNNAMAIGDYTKAINLAPDQSALYIARANCYRVLGQKKLAKADLAMVRQLQKRAK